MFHVTDTFYIRDNRPYSRYPPSLYALNFMIDGINIMSHGFSGGKQMIIFANTSNTVKFICLSAQSETAI